MKILKLVINLKMQIQILVSGQIGLSFDVINEPLLGHLILELASVFSSNRTAFPVLNSACRNTKVFAFNKYSHVLRLQSRFQLISYL